MAEENETTEETTEEVETEEIEDDALAELVDGLEDRLADRLEEKLGDRFDAVADRRVNAILKELRTSEKKGEEPEPAPQATTGNDRTRRALLKSAIQNELLMSDLSNEERKVAQELAFEMADSRSLGEDDDEFDIAASVVERVGSVLGNAKGVYQQKLREELKSRGVELEDAEQGQKKKSTKSKDGTLKSEYDKGVERARQMGLVRTEESA